MMQILLDGFIENRENMSHFTLEIIILFNDWYIRSY